MELNDLLKKHGIDPAGVLVLRHSPSGDQVTLRKWLPYLAAEQPDLFNAYQRTQTRRVEDAMKKATHVAAFIGRESRKAVFVGLYTVGARTTLTAEQFCALPEHRKLRDEYGAKSFTSLEPQRETILRFDLIATDFYQQWKGKLMIEWPGQELSWWRWAGQNVMPVHSILEESALVEKMPKWDELELSHDDLKRLPPSWRSALSHWRAIYYIFDTSDCKGYVGSACGDDNLLSRWEEYGRSGHGGNKLLRARDPKTFRFTILEILGHDQDSNEVTKREGNWKRRLHTERPYGLNEN